jgi:hypothetical protein
MGMCSGVPDRPIPKTPVWRFRNGRQGLPEIHAFGSPPTAPTSGAAPRLEPRIGSRNGVRRGREVLKLGVMVVATTNFMASIWFAQYTITGWLIALYVLGSFALACVSMLRVE